MILKAKAGNDVSKKQFLFEKFPNKFNMLKDYENDVMQINNRELLKNKIEQDFGSERMVIDKKIKTTALKKNLIRYKLEDIFNKKIAKLDDYKQEFGFGKNDDIHHKGNALSVEELNFLMKKYKLYIDTIIYNQNEFDNLYKFIIKHNVKKFSFIMLIIKNNEKFGHYVCGYIDLKNEYTVEYFDPFGEDPHGNLFENFINKLIYYYKINRLVKFKVNHVKKEGFSSSMCSWYCIRFLLESYGNYDWKIKTAYHKIKNNEENIKKFKNHFLKFGYL